MQVHDLPIGFMSEKVGKNVGDFLGTYIASYPNNFGGLWKKYMRIRVEYNIEKPLKSKMKIKCPGGN